MKKRWVLCAPDGGGDGNGGDPQPDPQPKGPETFEAWLETQDETVKGLLDSHTKGLKSALDSERQQRKDLAAQLREATAKAEKGSELEARLQKATGDLEAAERRATFLEQALPAGCSNPRAAFLVAEAGGLFTRSGAPDWEEIKQAAPELFPKPRQPQAQPGAGTTTADAAVDVNALIRRAARRL